MAILHTLPPRVPISASGLLRLLTAIITTTAGVTVEAGVDDGLLRLCRGAELTKSPITRDAKSQTLTEPRIAPAVVESPLPRRTNVAILAQTLPTALADVNTTRDVVVAVQAQPRPILGILNHQVADAAGKGRTDLPQGSKTWRCNSAAQTRWIDILNADGPDR